MEWLFLSCFFLPLYKNISMSLCDGLVLSLPRRALGTTEAPLVLWVTSLVSHKKPPSPDVPPSVILPQQHLPFSPLRFDHWLHLSKGSLSLNLSVFSVSTYHWYKKQHSLLATYKQDVYFYVNIPVGVTSLLGWSNHNFDYIPTFTTTPLVP